MKKIIALVIAILMMAAIAVPAFAANQTVSSAEEGSNTAGTQVTYTVEGAFTVTIPDAAVFAKAQDSEDITASIALSASGILDIGQTLTVIVDSENTTDANEDETKDTWNLKNGTELVAYTINDGAILPGATVLTYAAGAETATATLSLEIVTPATKAATYTDTLTFTVAVA